MMTTTSPKKVSGITQRYPSYLNAYVITTQSWLRGKCRDDGAEGLWRIYDTLYDFSNFVERHPGGSSWLEITKGTDITEQFEAHHISQLPEQMLYKFEVRKAATPRNYKLTFDELGFYKTLKARVREFLPQLDQRPKELTNLYHTALIISTFLLAMSSAKFGYVFLHILAGIALCWTTIAAHNYLHQRDSWRMYTFNLSLMNFSDWRVSHALSHHIYTNSLLDLEMTRFEPFLSWVPHKDFGAKWLRWLRVFFQPIAYAGIFGFQFFARLVTSLLFKNVLHWHDIIGFTLPVAMLLSSNASLSATLLQWLYILVLASFLFGLIGLNAGHHAPQIYHEGDAMRLNRDWGLFELDTIIDRCDLKGSQFMVLTNFGEHALHHLFPTLDHGLLPQLYPVFFQTLNELKEEVQELNHLGQILGQNQQLLRTMANLVPPDSGRSL